MGTNEKILQRIHAGRESVIGSGVTPTRRVYATLTKTYGRALQEFTDTSGTYVGDRRPSYGREKIGFKAVDIGTFEDLPWWCLFSIDGALSNGVTDGGSPAAYSRLFEPDIENDTLASFTFEHNEPGNPYETNQVMANSMTFRMNSDNDSESGWMIDADLLGLNWESIGSFTTAIPQRSTEVIKARGTKIYIDDEGDTFGDTQLVAGLISTSTTIQINRHFKAFAEDEKTCTPGAVGRRKLRIASQVTMEFDNDAEFANYRSDEPVLRKIRLEREGSVIHDAVRKLFQLDVSGYWNSWSEGDRDGNLIMTMGMQGFWDIDEDVMFRVNTVNAVGVLP
ncbi:MAG: hypothetical protein AB7V46_15870 [Thermomicrobiales bacterium]